MNERTPVIRDQETTRRVEEDPAPGSRIAAWKLLVGILVGAVSGASAPGCASRTGGDTPDPDSMSEQKLLQAFGDVDILAGTDSIKIIGNSPIATKILIRLIYSDGVKVAEEEEFGVDRGPFQVFKQFRILPPDSSSRVEIQDENGVIRSMKLPSFDSVPDSIPDPG